MGTVRLKTPAKTSQKPRKKHATRVQQRYSEADQIRACTAMVALGGLTYEGMRTARDMLGCEVSKAALGRWMLKHRDSIEAQLDRPPLNKPAIIDDTRGKVVFNLQSALLKLSDGLNNEEAIKKAAYRDIGVVAGIITDKLRLIAGTDPEVDELWRDFEQACIDSGHDAKSFFRDIISSLKQAPTNEPGPTSPGVLYREIDI